jgi:hypothetical protein
MILFCILFLCFIACARATENHIVVDNISFWLPENITIVTSSPVEDFILVNFRKENEHFLRAYLGGWPQDIYSKNERSVKEKLQVGNYSALAWRYGNNELHSGEILIWVHHDESWPPYLQFWYENVDAETLVLINEIVQNVDKEKRKKQWWKFWE